MPPKIGGFDGRWLASHQERPVGSPSALDESQSDLELLERWQASDPLAGEMLFDRHFDTVNRFLRNKVPDDAVDDLVQATFLGCLEARERLRPDTDVRVFLLVVARRRLYSYYRSQQRLERFDPAVSSIRDVRSSPSRVVARGQEEVALHGALDQIPIEDRLVIELRYFEELKLRDVAEVLQCPVGTAKTRLRAAKERLRAALDVVLGDSRAAALLISRGIS